MSYDRPRDELRERVQSAPGRKNRRKWCGGRAGRSHNLEIAVPSNRPGYSRGCIPAPEWWRRTKFGAKAVAEGRAWWCDHSYICTTCGKIVDALPPTQCPLRPKLGGMR
jgi:hypothetical protein